MRRYILASAAALAAAALAACGGGTSSPLPSPTPTPYIGKAVLYVADSGSNAVTIIDPVSFAILATIPVGQEPVAFAQDVGVSNNLYVANKMSGTVSVIDDTTNKVTATIAVGKNPSSMITWGGKVYVANAGSNSISVIDMATNAVVETDSLGTHAPYLIAQDSHGSGDIGDVATANSDGTVTILWPQKQMQVLQTIQVTSGTVTGLLGYGSLGNGSNIGLNFLVSSSGTKNQVVVLGYVNRQWQPTQTYLLSEAPLGGIDWYVDASGNRAIYAMDKNDNRITAIWPLLDDATQSKILGDVIVGRAPVDVASLWTNQTTFVANSGDDTISVVSASYAQTKTIALPQGAIPIKLLLGYNVAASPAPVPTATPTAAPTAAPTVKPTATPTAAPTSTPTTMGNLYVSDYGAHKFDGFALPVSAGAAPFAAVNDSSGAPYGMAEDPHAGIIAVEDDGGHVNIYKTPLTGSSAPSSTITLGGGSTGMLAFDVNGNLFVATGTSGVVEYSPPFSSTSTPSNTYSPGDHTMGIAFDFGGTMYVSNYGSGNIEAVSMPGGTVSATVTPPASTSVGGLIVHNGQLYAVDESNNAVVVYNLPLSNGATPAAVYKVSGMPQGIVFDGDGEMLLSNVAGGSVDFYGPAFSATMTPSFSLTGFTAPEQLTIGP